MIQDYILQFVVTAIVGGIAAFLIREWREHSKGIEASLLALPGKLASKVSLEWPIEYQDRWAQIVTDGVQYFNNFFSDPKQVRNFLRWVYSLKDVQKRDIYVNEMETALKYKINVVSPELSELINSWRHEEAKKMITASASVALPKEFVETKLPEINNNIKAAVIANPTGSQEPTKTPLDILKEFQNGTRGLHGK